MADVAFRFPQMGTGVIVDAKSIKNVVTYDAFFDCMGGRQMGKYPLRWHNPVIFWLTLLCLIF